MEFFFVTRQTRGSHWIFALLQAQHKCLAVWNSNFKPINAIKKEQNFCGEYRICNNSKLLLLAWTWNAAIQTRSRLSQPWPTARFLSHLYWVELVELAQTQSRQQCSEPRITASVFIVWFAMVVQTCTPFGQKNSIRRNHFCLNIDTKNSQPSPYVPSGLKLTSILFPLLLTRSSQMFQGELMK